MSSLAAQLAGIKANNNATILDKSKRKKLHSVSLIYDPKEAASQDFETVYLGSLEAFRELSSVDSRFLDFEKSLFSETSIRFDRMVQTADQNVALDNAIDHFLMLISGYLHLVPSFRVLEWLVRRFQIQVHNVESLFMATLPWHESEQFVRIMDIVYHQNIPPHFKFLLNAKKNLKGPSRSALVRVLSRDKPLLNSVNSYQLKVMKANLSFERQLVFWCSINSLIVMVHKEEGTYNEATDAVLPVITEVLPLSENPQAQIASYIILSFVASQFRLSGAIFQAAQATVINSWQEDSQFKGLVLISQLHELAKSNDLSDADLSISGELLATLEESFGSLANLCTNLLSINASNVNEFASALIVSVLANNPNEIRQLKPLFNAIELAQPAIDQLCELILDNSPFEPQTNEVLVTLVETFANKLNSSRLDRLELALQSHIQGQSLPTETAADEPEITEEIQTENQQSAEELLEQANDMQQSTLKSFFITPLPFNDARAQLWSRAAGSGLPLETLRKIARVSPEAEVSFYFAIAVGPWPTISRLTALKAINVLFGALISPSRGGKPDSIDLQASLPALVFLLSDPERRIRTESGKILRILSESKPSSKTPKWEGQLNLSWLSKSDMSGIFKKLGETIEECELDNQYIFSAVRSSGKAALCEFLSSYLVMCQIPPVTWACAKSLSQFKGVTKLVTPLLGVWNDKDIRQKWETLCSDSKFPLSGVEKSLVTSVKSNNATGIEFLLELMRTRSANVASSVGSHIITLWKDTFRFDTRCKVAKALVEIAINDQIEYDPTDVLFALQPLETDLFTYLFSETTSRSVSGEPLFNETSKRRRRRSSSSVQVRPGGHEIAQAASKHLRHTTVLLEWLDRNAQQLQGTGKLFGTLFDVLEELMALDSDSNLPILYTEEILANCLITLAEGLKTQSKLTRDLGNVKVGAVVSCIRTSSSPQVQNRLLLLIASLAGLCPSEVLHGVMPIFTFMGANTVRLDNDYSAHVIEHTIKQVIPALVSAGDRQEEIETALLSFVAAFPHIPRHRRNKLFGALVSVLDPQQCLYKLLLLLSQRYSTALEARKSSEARQLVQFTTPFLRGFSASLQIYAMCRFGMFVSDCLNSEAPKPTDADFRFGLIKIRSSLAESKKMRNYFFDFLARTAVDTTVISGTQPLRVHLAAADANSDLQTEDWENLAELMNALLVRKESEPAANAVLERILEALPIQRFVASATPLLKKDRSQYDDAEMDRVLTIISRKFEFESAKDPVAIDAAKTIMSQLIAVHKSRPFSSIIETVEKISAHFGTEVKDADLEFMDLICGSNGLLSKDDDITISSILAINTICEQLGALTYRFFPRIFPVLCDKVRASQSTPPTAPNDDEMLDDADEDADGAIELAVFAFFAGLVRQMPKFLAPETPVMLELVLSSKISISPRERFIEVLEQKISPSTLLPALLKSWQYAQSGDIHSINLYFSCLDHTIATVTRPDLAAEASNLTQLLISALSIRETSNDSNFVNQVESKSIHTVLQGVLRLNDRIFRPQFVKVVNWGLEKPIPARQIAALKFVLRVVQQLKSVVTSYFGHILDEICSIINNSNKSDPQALKLALQSLEISFQTDREDFWQTPGRFDPVLTALLSHFLLENVTHGTLVVKALTSLAITSSQQHRKQMNEGISALLKASNPSSQKVWGVKLLSSLYKHLGEEWVANLPQLVPLIAELLDDEDESVELETRRSLVPVIENVLGESLDRYLA